MKSLLKFLLAAAFVAILNETTMGVAIPHLITDLGITAVAAHCWNGVILVQGDAGTGGDDGFGGAACRP